MPGKLVGLSKEEVLEEIEEWAAETATRKNELDTSANETEVR